MLQDRFEGNAARFIFSDPRPRARCFACWSPAPEVQVIEIWGCPDMDDLRALSAELSSLTAPCRTVIDARRLGDVSTEITRELVRCVLRALSPRASRTALVHASMLMDATVGCFVELCRPPYPFQAFTELAPALAWLGCFGSQSLLAAVEARSLAPDDGLVAALRRFLQDNLEDVSLARASRALGLSSRTLQRRLQAAGTSFQAEVIAARVNAGQAMMRDTDLKLTAVALAVGCASLQHFSTLFRKHTGMAPSAWRASPRARGASVAQRGGDARGPMLIQAAA